MCSSLTDCPTSRDSTFTILQKKVQTSMLSSTTAFLLNSNSSRLNVVVLIQMQAFTLTRSRRQSALSQNKFICAISNSPQQTCRSSSEPPAMQSKLRFEIVRFDFEDALDFGAKVKYNTESLSFNCFNTLIKVDGDKKDFSNFSKVVDAIAKSGLKRSLTKIYIGWNDASVVEEAQRLLSVKGMTHISING